MKNKMYWTKKITIRLKMPNTSTVSPTLYPRPRTNISAATTTPNPRISLRPGTFNCRIHFISTARVASRHRL